MSPRPEFNVAVATLRAACGDDGPALDALDALEADVARWRAVLGACLERLDRTQTPTIALLLADDENAVDDARAVAREIAAARIDVDEVLRDLVASEARAGAEVSP